MTQSDTSAIRVVDWRALCASMRETPNPDKMNVGQVEFSRDGKEAA